MAIPFLNSRTQWLDADGNPYSYGRITFYEAGTSTPKTIYNDETESPATEADNPMPFDAGGYHQEDIWLGSGEYKYIVEKLTGRDGSGNYIYTPVYTKDNIPGSPISPSGIATTAIVAYVDDLRLITGGAYDAVYVLNHSAPDDGGGGWFLWDATETATDDDGVYISSLGDPAIGRFVRQVEGNVIYNTYYGIKSGDTANDYQGAIQNMSNFCTVNTSYSMWFKPGSYNISGDISFSSNCNLTLEDRVNFTNALNASPVTISIFSRQVDIKQKTAICDYGDTRLYYQPVVGPTLRLSWLSPYSGFITDNGILLEYVQGTGVTTDLIIDKSLRVGNLYTPNLSGITLYFEDDAYIQIDNQDLNVGNYVNRHGGQIWSTDIDRLTVEANVKVRASDFIPALAISNTAMSKLVSFATLASTVTNTIYFDKGSYTYDSAGSPTGDTNAIYQFDNASSLAVTGAFYAKDIIGSECITGTGNIFTHNSTRFAWFPNTSAGLEQAMTSAGASDGSSSHVLLCDGIDTNFTDAVAVNVLSYVDVYNLRMGSQTFNVITTGTTGRHQIRFFNCEFNNTVTNIDISASIHDSRFESGSISISPVSDDESMSVIRDNTFVNCEITYIANGAGELRNILSTNNYFWADQYTVDDGDAFQNIRASTIGSQIINCKITRNIYKNAGTTLTVANVLDQSSGTGFSWSNTYSHDLVIQDEVNGNIGGQSTDPSERDTKMYITHGWTMENLQLPIVDTTAPWYETHIINFWSFDLVGVTSRGSVTLTSVVFTNRRAGVDVLNRPVFVTPVTLFDGDTAQYNVAGGVTTKTAVKGDVQLHFYAPQNLPNGTTFTNYYVTAYMMQTWDAK